MRRWFGATAVKAFLYYDELEKNKELAKVGRCRLTASEPVLKAPADSALETII